MTASLQRLLSPRSIAVFGGAAAAETIRQCRKLGFTGDLWPVHPTRHTLEGLPCFASIESLPAPPDAAFVAVPSHATVDVVRQLQMRGSGGAICYASGFAEIGGGGLDLQADLVQAASGMALLGPNCYGLLNYLDGVALWPDQHGGERVARGVAIITQSGNIGLNLTMQMRGLPLAYLITVGNQAGDRMSAIIDTLLDDPRVTAIGLHIEGLDDVGTFSRTAIRALQQRIPIVALKAGSSVLGAQTTMSHTSSLAGPDGLYVALFQRVGVARVFDVSTLLETLKLVHVLGALPDKTLASASCSGGEASLMADLAQSHGLLMPALPHAAQDRLREVLGDKVTVSNPLDYHTYVWGNLAAQTECFAALMGCQFAVHILVLDFPRADRCDGASWQTTLNAFIAAKRNTGAPAVVLTSLPEGLAEAICKMLLEHGIAPMQGTADCLRAISLAAQIGAAQRAAVSPIAGARINRSGHSPQAQAPATSAITMLDEVASKRTLAEFGLSVPNGHCVGIDDVESCANAMGFPLVVKAVSNKLAHKTEAGGVKLNLQSAAAAYSAAQGMQTLTDRFLLEPMATNVVAEIIVGVRNDPLFGLALTVGAGGILVELLQDAVTILLPASNTEIRNALQGLKTWPLLCGYRGKAPADVEALVVAIGAIAAYTLENAQRLVELDVNPILVKPQGFGVQAVDALIYLTEDTPE